MPAPSPGVPDEHCLIWLEADMARDIVVFNIVVVVDNFFDFLLFPQNCSFEWRTKNDQELTMLPDALVKIYQNSKGVIYFPLFNFTKILKNNN